jgi:hypothetical protein
VLLLFPSFPIGLLCSEISDSSLPRVNIEYATEFGTYRSSEHLILCHVTVTYYSGTQLVFEYTMALK